MDRLKLLPCPFCGGSNLTRWRRVHKYAVLCEDCGANTPTEARWNLRQSLSQEAVRDEVGVEERMREAWLERFSGSGPKFDENGRLADGGNYYADSWHEWQRAWRAALRPLKREPNAAVRAEQPLTKWPSQEGHTEAAGPAPAASWIAVSKRLPKKNVTVLFYCDDGVTEKGMLTIEGWIADDDVDGSPTIGVTHWMPPPPAP